MRAHARALTRTHRNRKPLSQFEHGEFFNWMYDIHFLLSVDIAMLYVDFVWPRHDTEPTRKAEWIKKTPKQQDDMMCFPVRCFDIIKMMSYSWLCFSACVDFIFFSFHFRVSNKRRPMFPPPLIVRFSFSLFFGMLLLRKCTRKQILCVLFISVMLNWVRWPSREHTRTRYVTSHSH